MFYWRVIASLILLAVADGNEEEHECFDFSILTAEAYGASLNCIDDIACVHGNLFQFLKCMKYIVVIISLDNYSWEYANIFNFLSCVKLLYSSNFLGQ